MGVQKGILHRYLSISMSYDCFLCSDNFAFLVYNKSGSVGYLQAAVGTNPLLFRSNSQRYDYQGTSEHHLKLVVKMCRQPE